jgi:hypothetical protein
VKRWSCPVGGKLGIDFIKPAMPTNPASGCVQSTFVACPSDRSDGSSILTAFSTSLNFSMTSRVFRPTEVHSFILEDIFNVAFAQKLPSKSEA